MAIFNSYVKLPNGRFMAARLNPTFLQHHPIRSRSGCGREVREVPPCELQKPEAKHGAKALWSTRPLIQRDQLMASICPTLGPKSTIDSFDSFDLCAPVLFGKGNPNGFEASPFLKSQPGRMADSKRHPA